MPEVDTADRTQPTTSTASHSMQRPKSEMQPMPDMADYLKEYARQRPEVAALWCFGVGFVLGWKLKPW